MGLKFSLTNPGTEVGRGTESDPLLLPLDRKLRAQLLGAGAVDRVHFRVVGGGVGFWGVENGATMGQKPSTLTVNNFGFDNLRQKKAVTEHLAPGDWAHAMAVWAPGETRFGVFQATINKELVGESVTLWFQKTEAAWPPKGIYENRILRVYVDGGKLRHKVTTSQWNAAQTAIGANADERLSRRFFLGFGGGLDFDGSPDDFEVSYPAGYIQPADLNSTMGQLHVARIKLKDQLEAIEVAIRSLSNA